MKEDTSSNFVSGKIISKEPLELSKLLGRVHSSAVGTRS